MKKCNLKKFNRIYVLMDAGIIAISYLLAYYLKFYVLNVNNVFNFFEMSINEKWYSLNVYTDKLILMVPLYLFLYYFLNVYTPIENKLTLTKVFQIILANIMGIVLFLIALYLQKDHELSRKFLLLFFVMNVILSIVPRMPYSYYLKIMHRKHQSIS